MCRQRVPGGWRETENAREVKLLVITERLARRFVLEERKALDGRLWVIN